MGNWLRMEKRQQIQALGKLGWSARRISQETKVDRRTVAGYLHEGQPTAASAPGSLEQNVPEVPTDSESPTGQNVPEVPTDSAPPPPTNSKQVQPHTDSIRSLFLRELSAQRIYQDLVEERGYRGSYDAVKRYVRRLRKRHRRYAERLAHLPGREAQVDFGKSTCYVRCRGRYRRVWVFKMTLCCSKHAYEELVERQDVETFIRCHERAFVFFGGVPEIVTLDNLKSGVLRASLYEPELNPVYLAFATHWGFAANPCIPRTPEHKGVVEKKMPPNAADDLLEIIHRRYQTGATIIASNRIVSDWGAILGDNAATAAILDRFLDSATAFNIKGRSYRLKKTPGKETD